MKRLIDKKLFLILLAYMASYHVVYLSRRIILKAMGRVEYSDISWWTTAFEPALVNFLVVPPVVVLILAITKIMIEKGLKWSYIISIHFALSFVYTFAVAALVHVYEYFAHSRQVVSMTFEGYFVRTLFGSNLNYLGYVGFVTIIYSYYYIQKTSQAKIQEAQLSEQLQHIKMQVLKSQLNPHFLFNTLNSISSLIIEDAKKAQQMIGNLGDLLREVLLIKDQNLIAVSKEMMILDKYIDIMQTRFSDHLMVKKTIADEIKEALMPSMLLQPLLENSFKHGYSYETTSLSVSVSVFKQDKQLVIHIENDGTPLLGVNDTAGLGIQNLKERLKTLYEENFSFTFSNLKDKKGVSTEIKIPLTFA